MKNGNRTGRRRLSAGTVFMLILLTAVLGGSALVLGRLSSGATVDLSKLRMSVLDLQENESRSESGESVPAKPTVTPQTEKGNAGG